MRSQIGSVGFIRKKKKELIMMSVTTTRKKVMLLLSQLLLSLLPLHYRDISLSLLPIQMSSRKCSVVTQLQQQNQQQQVIKKTDNRVVRPRMRVVGVKEFEKTPTLPLRFGQILSFDLICSADVTLTVTSLSLPPIYR